MCKKVIACFLLITLQCSPVSSLDISRTSVQHHEDRNGKEISQTSVQHHEDKEGNVVKVVRRTLRVSGTIGGPSSSEDADRNDVPVLPGSLGGILAPVPAPEVPEERVSPIVPPVVPEERASSSSPDTDERASSPRPLLPGSLGKETTSGDEATTFAPAIPRIPHLTTGSFIIGFFLAILIVGVVFAAVRMFLKRRAEPRPYTVY